MPTDLDAELRDAIAHHAAGRTGAALAGYQSVLSANPNHPVALHHLGILALSAGRLDDAWPLLRYAAQVAPTDAGPQFHLGQLAQARGDLPAAEAAYRRAVSLAPGMAVAQQALGDLLLTAGRPAEAVGPLRSLVELAPQVSGAWGLLGRALAGAGLPAKAVAPFARAAELAPSSPAAHAGMADALDATDSHEAAAQHRARVVALMPDDVRALNNLAQSLVRAGRPGEGVDVLRRAIERDPVLATARVNLATGLRELGRAAEASAVGREAIERQPDDPRIGSAYLYGLHFDPTVPPAVVADEHRRWAERHADPLPPVARLPRSAGPRRLRVGYVSPDFRQHVVGRFVAPILAAHDREAFEVACYSDVVAADAVTAAIRSSASLWRDTAALDAAALAAAIAADGIDVLVDLTGHMAGHRLLAFARRPAPVQVSHVSYPASAGVPAIGFRVTDAHLDPTDALGPERLLRLPDSFYLYVPPTVPVARAARASRPITFGSLTAPNKATPAAVDLWAAVLRRVPESRLLLTVPADGSTRGPLSRQFELLGVDPARLDLEPTRPLAEYLSLYGRIDVVLDPQPYGGGITTCDALWCGVPVVTRLGPTRVGRAAASIVRTLGRAAWAVDSIGAYAETAAALVAGEDRGAELRGRLLASPLCDVGRYTRNLERLYREAWERQD